MGMVRLHDAVAGTLRRHGRPGCAGGKLVEHLLQDDGSGAACRGEDLETAAAAGRGTPDDARRTEVPRLQCVGTRQGQGYVHGYHVENKRDINCDAVKRGGALEARPVVCIQKIQSHKHVFPCQIGRRLILLAGDGVARLPAGRKNDKSESQAFKQTEGCFLHLIHAQNSTAFLGLKSRFARQIIIYQMEQKLTFCAITKARSHLRKTTNSQIVQ